jgi:hypothetical protein
LSTAEFTAILGKYEDDIRSQIAHHSKYRGWDSLYYNGFTALVLLFSAVVAMLPGDKEGWLFWIPKVLSALNVFLVALERTLGFGSRWRFHIEMESSYLALLDHLRTIQGFAPADPPAALAAFRKELNDVRTREKNIPGVSASAEAKPKAKIA